MEHLKTDDCIPHEILVYNCKFSCSIGNLHCKNVWEAWVSSHSWARFRLGIFFQTANIESRTLTGNPKSYDNGNFVVTLSLDSSDVDFWNDTKLGSITLLNFWSCKKYESICFCMTGLTIWENIWGRNEIASYSSLITCNFHWLYRIFSLFGGFQR